jgi:hypothetical protein
MKGKSSDGRSEPCGAHIQNVIGAILVISRQKNSKMQGDYQSARCSPFRFFAFCLFLSILEHHIPAVGAEALADEVPGFV